MHRVRRRPAALALVAAIVAAVLPAVPAAPVAAVSTTLVINEIDYDQASTDTAEFVELRNVGSATIGLGTVTLELVNGSGGGAVVYDTIALPAVDLAAGGHFVVCANAATVPVCDLDDGPDTNFIQNGAPDAIGLRVDGVLVDAVSYEGDSALPYREGTGVGLEDDPSGTFSIGRCPDGADSDRNADDLVPMAPTPGATNDCPAPVTPVINEFVANHTGADVSEFLEVRGTPGTSYATHAIIQLEGDSGSIGRIDSVTPVGTTDADGFWVSAYLDNVLENGTMTLLLVEGLTASVGADLDSDDDGVLDTTPWTTLVDSVAVTDGGVSDRRYSPVVLTPGYDGVSFTPGGASRIPDGADTDTAVDWVRNDFDGAGLPGLTGTPAHGEAYNTPGSPNEAVPAPGLTLGSCGDGATRIHAVQGTGAVSPLVTTRVVVEGIVVGDFQDDGQPDHGDLGGFHVQEEDADADGDPATSEGVFVRAPGAAAVAVGDRVRVLADVAEFTSSGGSSMTQLANVGGLAVCASGQPLPAATQVTLPVPSLDWFERWEGMLVTFPQALTISEYFNFDRFNEVVLTPGRQYQPTAVAEPGSPEAAAVAEQNRLGRITVDDGRSTQNPDPAIHPDGTVFDLANRFRGGDTVAGVIGVLDETFGRYRVHPTGDATHLEENPRTAAPADVGGSLTVASFNVLNYFTTLTSAGAVCGPAADQGCRGADTAEERERQRAKIVAALAALDADVVGLIEIENHPDDVPTADLVAGLNDLVGAGTYAYVATGAIGTDAIRVALVYRAATVEPVGDHAVLDSSVDARFDDSRNRPVLAQTFREVGTGGVVTVAVNHLKSKGSACGAGDDDAAQGNCNATRARAAAALVDWLAGDPTGSGDVDALVIGDLNAYDREEPIDVLRAGRDDSPGTADDWTDLLATHAGDLAYSYLFDGQLGYLDHALASPTLAAQVTGATTWAINADEPDILDYDMTLNQDAQDALYAPDPYRSSDHDPVVVGLELRSYGFGGFEPPLDADGATVARAGSAIPVKFELVANPGLDVLFESPRAFACGTWPAGPSVVAASADGTGLTYDAESGRYAFAWKTERAWRGTCRALVLTFRDGTYRSAAADLTR